MSAGDMISVCVAVYRQHESPNITTLAAAVAAACAPRAVELVVALNGIGATTAGVPDWARTVALPTNRGVAPGWNAAAAIATGSTLVFANDDCLPHPGALDSLADALQDDAVGVVGPAGARWEIATGTAGEEIHAEDIDSPVEVECVSGFLFACRRSTYDAVGGFDDFYAPASWEEIDFCTAVRAIGLRNYVVDGVRVEHEYGISRRQPPWRRVRFDNRSESLWSIHRRNRRHFLQKWQRASLPPVDA